MTPQTLWACVGAMAAIAGSGWATHDYLHDTFASKETVVVAGAKADFVLDQQMAAVISQIAFLERKGHLTSAELNQLNYLRQQLELMRKVKAGK